MGTMTSRDSKESAFCLFFSILLMVLANGTSASNGKFCRQGIFKPSKEPLYFNVTKQVFVHSVLQCAHMCQAKETCEAFKHRNVHDDINCQITKGKATTMVENDTTEKWTLYTFNWPYCKKNSCNGAGRCSVTDGCEPDGFKCECHDNYYGKYRQHEKFHDYDINFPNTTTNNVIDLGTIDINFNEFTFTAWIQFNPGFTVYPLLSYITGQSTKIIELAFLSDDASSTTVALFEGYLLGNRIGSSTVPINDGYWHHVGFVWSGVTGKWMLLIDGVLWATKQALKGTTLPSNGVVSIGKIISNGKIFHFVGNVSRVNLWSKAKTGSEIEEIAKRPGSEDGDLITWYKVKDFLSDLRIIRPSMAAFSGIGTNYEVSLPLANVSYPGLYKPTNSLSSCLWYFGNIVNGNTMFLVYDTATILEISSLSMVSEINGFSSNRDVAKGFRRWHFLCIQWDGIEGTVTYFYDGHQVETKIRNNMLITQLLPGKNFKIGLGAGIGTLTQLNVWDVKITENSVKAMSSGGFNVHGSVLSWSSLAKYLPDANIKWNTSIYLPGFTVLEKRTKWCNENIVGTSCPGQLLARLGGHVIRERMEWRCYCPASLHEAKYTYNFDTASSSYHSKHNELSAIN